MTTKPYSIPDLIARIDESKRGLRARFGNLDPRYGFCDSTESFWCIPQNHVVVVGATEDAVRYGMGAEGYYEDDALNDRYALREAEEDYGTMALIYPRGGPEKPLTLEDQSVWYTLVLVDYQDGGPFAYHVFAKAREVVLPKPSE